jgi:hypothetical protein
VPKALLVGLNQAYPQIAPQRRGRGDAALHNCTCVARRLNPARANSVAHPFGVYHGKVVSAYAVSHPVSDWPTIPTGALGQGRYCVPVSDVSLADWNMATSWTEVPMSGAVRYGEVQIGSGGLASRAFPLPAAEEELVDIDD